MLTAIEYENDGRKAENMAAKFLQKAGHQIIARNFKIPEGEIDIISFKDGTVYANEIKKRSINSNFKYITTKQMERIWYTLDIFLEQNPHYCNAQAAMQLILVQNNEAYILEII